MQHPHVAFDCVPFCVGLASGEALSLFARAFSSLDVVMLRYRPLLNRIGFIRRLTPHQHARLHL
jgi:hypothetical protein